DPSKGLLFDGRIAEDFKLATGTWVNVGTLRAKFIHHCAPYVLDAVIAGADKNEIAVLVMPNLEACRRLCSEPAGASSAVELLRDLGLRRRFQSLLDDFARQSTGSSNRITRAVLLEEPLSLDAGEVTDKGSINQRAVLQRRAHLIEDIYSTQPSSRVLIAKD